jgi:hypothetical protein
MAVNPRQELHELVDRLSEEEARRLSTALRAPAATDVIPKPRPLTVADIVLTEPILPNDETADEMIAAVRRWRREGGNA